MEVTFASTSLVFILLLCLCSAEIFYIISYLIRYALRICLQLSNTLNLIISLYHISDESQSHDELALELGPLLLSSRDVVPLCNFAALVEVGLHSSLRELLRQHLFELSHLEVAIPVAHVQLEFLQLAQPLD